MPIAKFMDTCTVISGLLVPKVLRNFNAVNKRKCIKKEIQYNKIQ